MPVTFQVKEETDETDSSAKDASQQPEKGPVTGAAIPDSVEEQPADNPAAAVKKTKSQQIPLNQK